MIKLDWNLQTSEERVAYLSSIDIAHLSPTEQSKVADYMLWPSFPVRKWKNDPFTLSLDQLIEDTITPVATPDVAKAPPFSRIDTLRTAPPAYIPLYQALWHDIDITDATINYYQIQTGARAKPPRDALLDGLQPAELLSAMRTAAITTPYAYSRMRHHLVDLRRQQYEIRDEYKNAATSLTAKPLAKTVPEPIELTLWPPLQPQANLYPDLPPDAIDMTQVSVIAALTAYPTDDMPDDVQTAFEFFAAKARDEWPQHYGIIWDGKQRGDTNTTIAKAIADATGHAYSVNYISTMYTKKVVPSIAQAAADHLEEMREAVFPENWKKCTRCGRNLVRNDKNFRKRGASPDGYAARCKKCESRKQSRL